MSLQPDQIDYSKNELSDLPTYRYSRVAAQDGTTAATINESTSETIFQVPAKVANWSRDYISLTLTPAGTAGAGNYYNFFSNMISPIRQIQLYNRGGQNVVDLNYQPQYTRMVLPAETKASDMEEYSELTQNYFVKNCGNYEEYDVTSRQGLGFGAVNTVEIGNANGVLTIAANAGVLPAASPFLVGDIIEVDTDAVTTVRGTVIATANGPPITVTINLLLPAAGAAVLEFRRLRKKIKPLPYRYNNTLIQCETEPLYLRQSLAANTALPVLNVKIPLNQFKNTFFEMDKDVYFNEMMMLKIVWATRAELGFRSLAQGYIIPAPPAANPNLVIAHNINITNLYLYHALEVNETIRQSIINKTVSSGMSMLIPYVYASKNNIAGGATQTNTLFIGSAQGMKLKKVYTSVYPADEILQDRFNVDNTANNIVGQFVTKIDDVKLQEFSVQTAQNHDYLLLEDKLKGTVLSNIDAYKYNWFWVDCFDCGVNDLQARASNINSGMPLSVEHKYVFEAEQINNAAHNFYSFTVVSRMLTINPDGVMVK